MQGRSLGAHEIVGLGLWIFVTTSARNPVYLGLRVYWLVLSSLYTPLKGIGPSFPHYLLRTRGFRA